MKLCRSSAASFVLTAVLVFAPWLPLVGAPSAPAYVTLA